MKGVEHIYLLRQRILVFPLPNLQRQKGSGRYLFATRTTTIGIVTDETPVRTIVKLKKIEPNDF